MIRPFRIAGIGAVGLVAFLTALGGFYTVDQGYRGVITRWGAVTGVAEPGLGFKVPFIDNVRDMSVKEHTVRYDGGQADGGLLSYSFDQQTASIRVSVNYAIPPGQVSDVYARFGSEEGMVSTILNPNVYNSTKESFGQFTALKAVQDRNGLGMKILENLQAAVKGYPIEVRSIQVENIDFSDAYEDSIEQRMTAEIEVQKIRQNAEREQIQAQIVVIQAQATADATLAQATAQAKATQLAGEAEATAIRAKGDALAANPALVTLIQAEKWDGVLPTTMVPGGTVPFLNVDGSKPSVVGKTALVE